jgi:RNA polymerase sigma-70 factor (ECF subfamily)
VETCTIPDRVTLPQTDRELARALARGDRSAIEALYEAHCDAVYAFAYFRMGRVREDAEDVVADTFLTALGSAGAFQGRSSIGAWLRGIARNKCRESFRRRAGRASGREVPLDTTCERAFDDLRGARLPLDLLESEEVARSVSAVLAVLPDHYRELLVAKYVDKKTLAEIARERGVTPKAAESGLHRARRALERLLPRLHRRASRHAHEDRHD